MNGPPPPPGIPAPRLGPLALNLKNAMLRKNTNARLAALNSIGVSPPEKNLPRLSNLAPFPVPEPVLAPPNRLSAKSSNWSPPLPPGPPPRPAPVNNNYSRFYNAAYNVPDWEKPPPPMEHWIDFLKQGGRLYREQFMKEDWRTVWDFIGLYRNKNNIRYWSKDNKTGENVLHPYFYIPKYNAPKTRRKRKQSRGTRRHQ